MCFLIPEILLPTETLVLPCLCFLAALEMSLMVIFPRTGLPTSAPERTGRSIRPSVNIVLSRGVMPIAGPLGVESIVATNELARKPFPMLFKVSIESPLSTDTSVTYRTDLRGETFELLCGRLRAS